MWGVFHPAHQLRSEYFNRKFASGIWVRRWNDELSLSLSLCAVLQVCWACRRVWTCTGTSSARGGAASVRATPRPSSARWSSRCSQPGWAASQNWVSTRGRDVRTETTETDKTCSNVLLLRQKHVRKADLLFPAHTRLHKTQYTILFLFYSFIV